MLFRLVKEWAPSIWTVPRIIWKPVCLHYLKQLVHIRLENGMQSGRVLPEDNKHELSEIVRKHWQVWKVNINDIDSARNRNRNRKRIAKGAAGDAFLARMQMRDENDDITDGKHMDVAVKPYILKRGAQALLPQFMNEMYFQKYSCHHVFSKL